MPLAGHDLAECRWSSAGKISTPMPLAGHDMIVPAGCCEELVISTPMPLAGHDNTIRHMTDSQKISTPMPLAGHDRIQKSLPTHYLHFYSHAPRGA